MQALKRHSDVPQGWSTPQGERRAAAGPRTHGMSAIGRQEFLTAVARRHNFKMEAGVAVSILAMLLSVGVGSGGRGTHFLPRHTAMAFSLGALLCLWLSQFGTRAQLWSRR
ncbi:hypothetical protein T492DRAFT_327086 [Pavlovales sp. CCMP2436]|nr:hypothetical protein T492DRAFT_327086 [Pavlovales sp. CCMP2436]